MVTNLRSVLPEDRQGWAPPVLTTVASEGKGVPELADRLEEHFSYLKRTGKLGEKERIRSEVELRDALTETMLEKLAASKGGKKRYEDALDKVVARKLDPHAAARRLLSDKPR